MIGKQAISVCLLAASCLIPALVRAEVFFTQHPEAGGVTLPAAGDGPVFTEETHRFGPVLAGERIAFTFTFTNPNSQPLEIISVRPSCGCTQAGEFTRRIGPGQTGQIPLALNTTGMRGAIRRAIEVTSTSPVRPKITLWLEGQVGQALEVIPEVLVFGRMDSTRQVHRLTARVVAHAAGVSVSAVKSTVPAFSARLRTITAGQEWEVAVETAADLAPGTYAGAIELICTGAGTKLVWIQVSAFVPAAVEVIPQKLLIAPLPLPSARETSIYLKYGRPGRIAIERVTATDPAIGLDVVTDKPGREYRVMVRFPKGFTLPAGSSPAITITLTEPDAKIITVPVIGEAGR